MKFPRTFICFACAMALIGLQSAQLHGEIIVNILDAQISAGETGFVNVMVESDSSENLDLFQYKFRISGVGANVGGLRFLSPQLSSEVSAPNYIHSGDSGGFISVAQNGPQFDEVLGGDFTSSFAGTELSSERLFAQLDIEHILPTGTPSSAASSDQFSISLIDDGDTFFSDSAFNTLAFSSTGDGQVEVVVAVPEPGSGGLLLLSTAVLMQIRRRRQQ